jgi:predicted metalloprotease
MRPAVVGGGILGLIIILVGAYFGKDLRPLAQQLGGGGKVEQVGPPPDPKDKEFAERVLFTTEEVWADEFRKHGYGPYEKPGMVLFSEQVTTGGCGTAPSAVGPFYCPADKKLYLDPTFFEELEQKLGGSKGQFSQAYVVAHEVGHHVQNLIGYNRLLKKYESREGKNAGIRLELQADYLAGVWANRGQQKFKFIEPGDVKSALTTARAIGDNRIAEKSGGWVSPESFTHGTDDQRVRWFTKGMETGDASKRVLDHFFDPNIDPLKL